MDVEQVYLLQTEKEVWDKGVKLSKPSLSYVHMNDFLLMKENAFYEKEQISVEILHDPTFEGSPVADMKTLKEKKGEGDEGGNTGGAPVKEGKKTKADLVKEYAALMEISVEDVDPKMTVKELQAEIDTIKNQN